MKKFLFTLVALLTAGSAFATNEYWYMDPIELTAEDVANGATVVRPINAHFEAYVSSFMVTFTLPEGVTVTKAVRKDGLFIDYFTEDGEEDTYKPSLGKNTEMTKFIVSTFTELGYTEDGECYGVLKWGPGEYLNMWEMTFQFPAGFEGGQIAILSEPSVSGDLDNRPEFVPTDGKESTHYFDVTVPEVEDIIAPEPTFVWSEESFTMEAVCENHEVTLMIGEQVVSNPYTVEQTYEDQEITFAAFTVANADEDANSGLVYSTVMVPAKEKTPSNKPTIAVTPGDTKYTIEANGTGTVELYVNGEKVDNPYEINRPAYGEADITVTVKASNLDVDELGEIQYEIAWSAEQEVIVPAMEPEYYQTPDPEITVVTDEEAQTVTITATGEGTVTLKVTGAFGLVDQAEGQGTCSVVIPFGEEVDYVNAYATATAEGEFVYPGDATKDMIEIPAKPAVVEQTDKPVITSEEVEGGVNVTATGNGHICLYVEDVLVAEGEGTATYFIASTEMEEEYGVSATAQEQGKLVSDYALETVYVPGLVPEDTTLDGVIEFSELNEENGQFTITYTGDEAGVVITIDNEDIIVVRDVTNTYRLPAYGEYTIKATASGVGYDNVVEKTQTYVWEKEVVAPTAPEITINTFDDYVTLGASDVEGATVYFYQCDDETGANPRLIENPTNFNRETENYDVFVYAVAVNEAGETSSVVTKVVIPAKVVTPPDPTSINEMNGGKAVAGVRYFNMAGQEMQEANGMTIVVTTYTDGTTSAVKVMK